MPKPSKKKTKYVKIKCYSEGSPHELLTDPGLAEETRERPIRLQT